MIDEEFLRPSREHLTRIRHQIQAMEAETARNIDRYGRDDKEYANQKWGEYHLAIEPMRRELEAVVKVIVDYYALQPLPQLFIETGFDTRSQITG